MYNDTIFLLNLKEIQSRIEKIDVVQIKGIGYFHIWLKNLHDPCPICGSTNSIVKEYRKKKLIHSISTNLKCYLIYHARRFQCPTCKSTYYEYNPLSYKYDKVSRFTAAMILKDLLDHTRTFKSVAGSYNVSTTTVINIFDNYVKPYRRKLPEVICIDEFYTSKLSATKYAAVLLDFLEDKIIDIYPSRRKRSLDSQISLIPLSERDNVRYVCIDMWDPYLDISHRLFKNAVVAVDSFHVIKHLSDALDKIRISVMKKFDNKTEIIEENTFNYIFLKRFHWFFTSNFDDLSSERIHYVKALRTRLDKYELKKYLLDIDDDLKQAYLLKEKYIEFNASCDFDHFDEEFYDLVEEFFSSKFDEFHEFGKLLVHWKKEIKNSFIRFHNRRLSNGPIEGMNSKIKTIFKEANGFNNFDRMRSRAMYSLNKDVVLTSHPKNKK